MRVTIRDVAAYPIPIQFLTTAHAYLMGQLQVIWGKACPPILIVKLLDPLRSILVINLQNSGKHNSTKK